jgi:hypothetical protein
MQTPSRGRTLRSLKTLVPPPHPPSTHTQAIFYWTLVTRQVLRRFDSDPALCLPSLPPDESGGPGGGGGGMRIALSESQEAQIREIFNLFDTDGGGSIDRREMDFAMVALGFQSKGGQANAATAERIEAIVADGTVTLEEFSALMTGEPAPPVLFAAAACNEPAGHARMCAGLVCPALLDGDTRETWVLRVS